MENLLRELSPETLAKVTVAMGNLLNPGMSETDFVTLNRISTQVFNIGTEKDKAGFNEKYFDAVLATS